MKKVLSIFLVFAMLPVFLLDCFAISVEPVEDLIKTSYSGKSEIKEITAINMQKISNNQFVADDIKIKQIFNEIGVKNIEYSAIFNELVSEIDYIGAVISSSSYYELNDNDGTIRQIDKAECVSKVEQSAMPMNSSVGGETVSDNGYMVITTSAVAKTNEAVGTYSVIAYYEWLKLPITRSIDAVSVASDNITWDMGNSTNYSAVMIAPYTYWDGITTTENVYSVTKSSPEGIYSNGYYYSFDLPNNTVATTRSLVYDGISMIVTGKGRVDDYDDGTQMLWINAKYAHVQIKSLFTIEFGWEIGSYPGVTISQGAITEKEYHNYLCWDYSLHYNLF